MRVTRVYMPGPLAVGQEVTLPEQAGAHLTRVLRLEPGDACTLFDGSGGEYSAVLARGAELPSRNGKQVRARVLAHDPVERESPLAITLLQGVARGERMDLIVQKATELGVTRILPVMAERSVVKVDDRQKERKRDHWQAIAVSACEQSGRNRVPPVAAPAPLADAIAMLPADSRRCLLAADGADPLASGVRGDVAIVLLIGPEGGLADNEQKFARAHGFIAYRIGPRILRTETAGLAAIAALQTMAGDFNS
jgi:16S rRNA (uracil1498-N3)-methyltransferase